MHAAASTFHDIYTFMDKMCKFVEVEKGITDENNVDPDMAANLLSLLASLTKVVIDMGKFFDTISAGSSKVLCDSIQDIF